MKRFLMMMAGCLALLISCKNDDAQRAAEKARDDQKKQAVFETVEKNWRFTVPVLNAETQQSVANWAEWRLFTNELRQRPKSGISAFRKQAKSLAQKALSLRNNMPPTYTSPEVRARITALLVTVQSLDLYIGLDDVPAEKVTECIREINLTLKSLGAQLEEINARSHIKLEQGESDMIRMLDTARAIPGTNKPQRP